MLLHVQTYRGYRQAECSKCFFMNASPGPKQNTNNRNARLASSLEFSNDFLHVKLLAISAEFLITFRPAQKHRGILINICRIFLVNDPAVLDNTSWECGKITFQFEYLKK